MTEAYVLTEIDGDGTIILGLFATLVGAQEFGAEHNRTHDDQWPVEDRYPLRWTEANDRHWFSRGTMYLEFEIRKMEIRA
jgi:hypothetical protein